jgi:NADPH-dependent curcumin reductase CurA
MGDVIEVVHISADAFPLLSTKNPDTLHNQKASLSRRQSLFINTRDSSNFVIVPQSYLGITMASATIPAMMKSLLQPDPASKSVILITAPVPVPVPNSTEHLIRVHAAALTNGELLWMKNFPPPPSLSKGKELVPCYDMAGTIVTAPSDSAFQPGSEIFARSNYYDTGSGREYTICETSELAFKPKRLSFAQAATMPMSAETAYQALFVHAQLQPVAETGAKGKRVFVTAGSGAAGMVCRLPLSCQLCCIVLEFSQLFARSY